MEFLGDAVLGWAVADISYRRFEHTPEGQLTDLRKSVVNALALADVAREIDLGPHIRLGRGESAARGSEKPSILSDAFEAVLGAVYLDGGAPAAHAMVDRLVAPGFPATIEGLDQLDNKTQLQELAARAGRGAPIYSVTSTGPDHAKTFVALVHRRRRGPRRGLRSLEEGRRAGRRDPGLSGARLTVRDVPELTVPELTRA